MRVDGYNILKHTYLFGEYHKVSISRYEQIDHIDGNKLNNQINNLRIVNIYQNNQNRKKRRDNSSGYTGVYKLKSGKYTAEITAYGNKKRLGTFESIEDAKNAREIEMKKLNENFGCLFRLNDQS